MFDAALALYKLFKIVLDSIQQSVFGYVPRCRHSPSCSVHAIRMMKLHGTMRGGLIGLRRLMTCWGVIKNA